MVATRRSTRASSGEAGAGAAASWAETAGAGGHQGAWGLDGALGVAVQYAGAALLLVTTPAFAIYLCIALMKFDASPVQFWKWAASAGPAGVWAAWPSAWDTEAWRILAVFGAFQAFLQLALPGAKVKGPVTPKGNVPTYVANGVPAYIVTMLLLAAGHATGTLDLARVYDKFPEILSALNAFSLALCVGLWAKGHAAPSSSDSGTTGSLLYDFYWGMELYPRIGSAFDIKTWTNCRMGMMGWASLCWAFAAAQGRDVGRVTDSMWVTAILINVYLFKFFWHEVMKWEPGYWASMDIAHDRAGYYICWGCLVWVPSVYAGMALYLGGHPRDLGTPLAAACLAAGLAAIWINYDADRQRQVFRATGGKALVWGKPPVLIRAPYTTAAGERRTSILLASGWWGLARHFHYVPEIAAAALWTAPVGGATLAWFYVFFLTLLLFDRAFRDDARCAAKYGAAWDRYRALVPAKIVPGVF